MRNLAIEFTLSRETIINDLQDDEDARSRVRELARPVRCRIMPDGQRPYLGMTLFVRTPDGFGDFYWERDATVLPGGVYMASLTVGKVLPLVIERLMFAGKSVVKKIVDGGEILDLGDL